MLISSTITASASRGSFSVFENTGSRVFSSHFTPRRRWMVWASESESSLMRLAARPVGAASTVSSPIRRNRATMPRRVVVLPVPGPPVRISTPFRAASSTACRCWGA